MCARALEMPFSSTFSAAAGVTELLRGWDVAQRLHSGALAVEDALAVGPLQYLENCGREMEQRTVRS